jgi:hypothetical protein
MTITTMRPEHDPTIITAWSIIIMMTVQAFRGALHASWPHPRPSGEMILTDDSVFARPNNAISG